MKFVQCYRCRARFHTGVIYEVHDSCPRCGTLFSAGRASLRERFRQALKRRMGRDGLDWEAITGSQYLPRREVATSVGEDRNRPAPA
jgi:hypothetical protein